MGRIVEGKFVVLLPGNDEFNPCVHMSRDKEVLNEVQNPVGMAGWQERLNIFSCYWPDINL